MAGDHAAAENLLVAYHKVQADNAAATNAEVAPSTAMRKVRDASGDERLNYVDSAHRIERCLALVNKALLIHVGGDVGLVAAFDPADTPEIPHHPRDHAGLDGDVVMVVRCFVLSLSAVRSTLRPGQTLSITVCGGNRGERLWFGIVRVAGIPMLHTITFGNFGATGEWRWSAVVPPSAVGLELDLQALSVPNGRWLLSNPLHVSIR